MADDVIAAMGGLLCWALGVCSYWLMARWPWR